MSRTAQIVRIGAQGDGLAETEAGVVAVPFALPGETVELEAGRREPPPILCASTDRVAPICPHFGRCGGCRLQHWRAEPYLGWKRELVVTALRRVNLDIPVDAMVDAHGAGRRRVTFHARQAGGEVATGFMRAGSHEIVPIAACPILAPGLLSGPVVAADFARDLAAGGKPLDIAVTLTESGLDVALRGHGPLDASARERVVAVARRHDLARVANHNEVVLERRPVGIAFGRSRVALPPAAFLQATEAGERVIAGLVAEAVGNSRRVADLFSGIGPLALRLAGRARVLALDQDTAAIAALTKAARDSSGLKPIDAQTRDLFRRPLLAAELRGFDAVVLDPPRQGAEAQIAEIARARPACVVYVSCNPASFARDAAMLVRAGLRLDRVTPLDQFRYSPHVELVGVFRS